MNTRRLSIRLSVLLLFACCGAPAADCVKTSDVCVDAPATRMIAGQAVTRACWRQQASFDCVSTTLTDDCQALRDRGCSPLDSRCVDGNADGLCTLFEQTWQCHVSGGGPVTVTNCGTQRYCLDGQCLDTGYVPDADFARAVTGLEVQREAGKYLDDNSLTVFHGFESRCEKKLGGLVNCCQTGTLESSPLSNLALIAGATSLGDSTKQGSPYTHDALFRDVSPALALAGFAPLFAGDATAALSDLFDGHVSVPQFIDGFAPASWASTLLATELANLLACSEDEQTLALKRERRLCHGVGSYCSSRLPLLNICIETTESYCCFNSRLARLIHEQGRAQLGRGWGAPEAPQCGSFTVAELQSLDFARMDLSEFYAEIAPTLPDSGAIRARVQRKVQETLAP